MSSCLLEVNGLKKDFDGIRALGGFSCKLPDSQILGLIGPNGAGKTSVFNAVTGLLVPDCGQIVFKNKDISTLPSYERANLGISRTFQQVRLVHQISVLDNVLLFFRNQPGEKLRNLFFNRRRSLKQESVNCERALSLLEEAHLTHKLNDSADALSYGQQKLLSLVCCLAAGSEVLLLDEPVAGIASELTETILETIRKVPAEGKSVILIEHNLDAVMQICDRVIFMDAGVMVSEGTPDEVRNDPNVIGAYIE